MKSGQNIVKSEERTYSLDNLTRQAAGRDSVQSYSRAGENPVQWIQLLNALEQQDHSGWPLSYPKVQMQKCNKCAREFCSPINYRRHIRIHRRSLNIDKDSPKTRDFLGEFWDKLSYGEAKEILSFNDVMLEDVSGLSIIRALTSVNRKPGFFSLPQVYVRAGTALLDLIQGRFSRFPISSKDLFSILDDASEKTFLCPGTAISMQKFMFDGEPGKIGLEMKNLIACTSFLMEQKLIKEWYADKDAEALRCQKLLVEEEEAAQRRQTELLERKRLKKLRQKEPKAKVQVNEEELYVEEGSSHSVEVSSAIVNVSTPQATSNSQSHAEESVSTVQSFMESTRLPNTDEEFIIVDIGVGSDAANSKSHIEESVSTVQSFLEPTRLPNTDVEIVNVDIGVGSDAANPTSYKKFEPKVVRQGNGHRRPVVTQRRQPSPKQSEANIFHSGEAPPVPKMRAIQKKGTYWDQKPSSLANTHKVWTRKTKVEDGEDMNGRVQKESRDKSEQDGNFELLIGSIPVKLGDCGGSKNKVDQCSITWTQEKPVKPESGKTRSKRKLWKPVGKSEAGKFAKASCLKKKTQEAPIIPPMDESYAHRDATDGCCTSDRMNCSTALEEAHPRGSKLFSARAAEAFLAHRWKEAIAADHVKLVLPPEAKPPCHPDKQEDAQVAPQPLPPPASDCCGHNILRSSENRLRSNEDALGRPNTGPNQAGKSKSKPERRYKRKYIPKQRDYT